jgi:hypothetical protein
MSKIKEKKNKRERLEIVLEIVKKLKNFPTSERTFIDIYNSEFPTIAKLKEIFNEYINQDDNHPSLIYGLNGKLLFPEINRRIIYVLPVKKDALSTFILQVI